MPGSAGDYCMTAEHWQLLMHWVTLKTLGTSQCHPSVPLLRGNLVGATPHWKRDCPHVVVSKDFGVASHANVLMFLDVVVHLRLKLELKLDNSWTCVDNRSCHWSGRPLYSFRVMVGVADFTRAVGTFLLQQVYPLRDLQHQN